MHDVNKWSMEDCVFILSVDDVFGLWLEKVAKHEKSGFIYTNLGATGSKGSSLDFTCL